MVVDNINSPEQISVHCDHLVPHSYITAIHNNTYYLVGDDKY